MQCKKLINVGGAMFPCRQCLPCRINRRREWTHRIMLEAKKHEKNSFVTLTYSPEFIPSGGSLYPEHAQRWLKRLRKQVSNRIRFYLVGEYGDNTFRPHYHGALFGLGVHQGDIVNFTWGMGHTHTGDLTYESAQYIAGYVTKKMTSKDDPRLGGRHPEFSRMSLRPGIGSETIEDIKRVLKSKYGEEIIKSYSDVPAFLQHGAKKWPLDTYMRNKLRDAMEWEKTLLRGRQFPEEVKDLKEEKMQDMRLLYETDKEAFLKKFHTSPEERKQKARNIEKKHEIYNKRSI
jgi:hypothetical protein